MQISRRLQAVSGMVTSGFRLADVGTDHGYIPIELVRSGRVPHAVAMDINRGPLLRAQENIRRYGLEGQIETRLSDGLHALAPGEADSVVIAGMGGLLVVRILQEGSAALEGVRELILQPQSELRSVRLYLEEAGYEIADEDLVCEDGKFYPMMRAVRKSGSETGGRLEANEWLIENEVRCGVAGGKSGAAKRATEEKGAGDSVRRGTPESEQAVLRELGLCYGPVLLGKKHCLLGQYLAREETLIVRVLESLAGKCTEAANERRAELLGQLELLRRAEELLDGER